ncbi:hypothetical protein M5D96_003130, partial [Drosophila gunungcola]
ITCRSSCSQRLAVLLYTRINIAINGFVGLYQLRLVYSEFSILHLLNFRKASAIDSDIDFDITPASLHKKS